MVPVKIGLENLGKEVVNDLKKKRVGLITNRTGITRDFEYTVDYFRRELGIKLATLFSPEHGFHLNEQAGEAVDSYYDKNLGIEIHSIYRRGKGSLKYKSQDLDEKMRSFDIKDDGKFIPEAIADELDTVVLDIQDIGTRVYTHISSMANAMYTCARKGIEFIVLDRPNPINGIDFEGPVLDYPKYRSFIGSYSITMRHGMTLGELARMFNEELFSGNVNLKVSRLKDWKSRMWFDQTGWPWVLPSPNMPSLDTATVYPGQVMFEGTNVSEGRGTTRPFEIIGAPWIDGYKFARDINALKLEGVKVNEIRFTPTFSKYSTDHCYGIEIHVTDRTKFKPFRFSLKLLDWIIRNEGGEFDFYEKYFDRVAGNSYVRSKLLSGDMDTLWDRLATDESEFKKRRDEYLLYR